VKTKLRIENIIIHSEKTMLDKRMEGLAPEIKD